MLILCLLWLLVALALGLVGLAAYALRVERREGLRPSYFRLGAIAAVALAMALVAGLETTRALAHAASAPSAPSGREELAQRRASLVQQRADLDRQIAELDAAIASGHALPAASPPDAAAPTHSVPASVLWGLALLALVGVVVLFATTARGSLSPAHLLELFRKRKNSAKTAENGDASQPDAGPAVDPREKLTTAALEGRYDEGLTAGAMLIEDTLPLLEQLDVLYLRAYCAVQRVAQGASGERLSAARRTELCTLADRDLARLLEQAPNMAEALYLRGMLRAVGGDYGAALTGFRAARGDLAREELPFAHNESVCHIELATDALQRADAVKASEHLEEVSRLAVLADHVPYALVSHRLSAARAAIKTGEVDQVRAVLKAVRETPGLPDDVKARAESVCDVYEIVALARKGNDERTLAAVMPFLKARLPAGLPDADDEAADEFLFAAVEATDLPLPPAMFRGLYFLAATAEARVRAERRAPLTEATAAPIRAALLRALQFEPRHRESLAALGALYYWFVPGKRERGIAWIRAAVTMGTTSAVLRRLLERHRVFEAERQGALEQFLGASMRFLTDPTVAPDVRRALVTELGRFQDFQPLVISLGDRALPEAQSPTLEVLRDRARYVAGLAEAYQDRRTTEERGRLRAVEGMYRKAVESLEGSVTQIEELEKQVMTELGKAVLT